MNQKSLEAALRTAVRGDVRFDTTTRATYSTDASNYRHIPIGVVFPVDAEDVRAILQCSTAHRVPVLARGAGTSIGGQATNTAVVIDFTRCMNQVLDIDPQSQTARVQPGVVLDDLCRAAARHGLTFGPDPSTHDRCTIGGMIGNDACGAHSVAWGKTLDNIAALTVVVSDGSLLEVGPTPEAVLDQQCGNRGETGRIYSALRSIRDNYTDTLRDDFPSLPRRVSGYNVDQLLPARNFDVAKALVGSEGTCATVIEAVVNLVPLPRYRALAVLGFPDSFAAADSVPIIREAEPLAIEGIDKSLVDALTAARPRENVVSLLPPGGGWLYVETGAETRSDAERRASDIHRSVPEATGFVVSDPIAMAPLWRIREDGAGVATRLANGREAYPGWEDASVAPTRLGLYLREFMALLQDHSLEGAFYGHYGDGCVHIRIAFDLLTVDGVRQFRRFVEESADLVVSHGGSLSGEHGDGQARAELWPRMFSPRLIEAFESFKGAWDPENRLNPGRLVRPRPLDSDLRLHVARPTISLQTRLAFHEEPAGFAGATRRCIGVGRCITSSGGVMCPSYRVTRQEEHSTRGGARLLFEMASGDLVAGGWRSSEVREALDLCLSCKGCKRDCPVNVDMAAYKSEFLSNYYAFRARPRSHYSMGWLPLWLRLASQAPHLFNELVTAKHSSHVVKMIGAIPAERSIPTLSDETFVQWFKRRSANALRGRTRVLVFPDTFTNYLDPTVGKAAVKVLEGLGLEVEVPHRPVCCGLTWLSTGQIGVARRMLRRTAKVLAPWLDEGLPIIGLEPSCTALFRTDAENLIPDDPLIQRLGRASRTFAEVLGDGVNTFDLASSRALSSTHVTVQVHCHQYADLGFDADREILRRLGIAADVLDSGCCGLAGNFGFEKGHYDVSMACAEQVLLPAVRAAGTNGTILADGFSCRTQIRQATNAHPLHLAQLVEKALTSVKTAESP